MSTIVQERRAIYAGAPGELLDMADGSLWFHPYSGADPVKITPHNRQALTIDNPAVSVYCWYVEERQGAPHGAAAGWYWDTGEDTGGFDRISPMGPFERKDAAHADAMATFTRASIRSFDGLPDHYTPEGYPAGFTR